MVKMIAVWVTVIIGMLTISTVWMAFKPASDMMLESLNDTLRPTVSGTARQTFDLIANIWQFSYRITIVLSLLSLLLFAYMKMQEKEVITGAF